MRATQRTSQSALRRVWHRGQQVPDGINIIDGIGRPWRTTVDKSGVLKFTDGVHEVRAVDIEFPVEEQA